MTRKKKFDTAMLADMKAVGADSFKDSIRMIEIDKIKPSMDNFYSMTELEMLAEDIERQGLKHNLVVNEDADEPGTYFIKSGHRRFAAIQQLVSENRYTSQFIPCLIDGIKSHSENMLDLIMLNATTRVMTDAEIYQQYEVLRTILEQVKSENKNVKGRLRERVAEFLNISPAQVGKIENIRHHAAPEIQDAVQIGDLSIATADKIAKLPEPEQKQLAAEHDLSTIKTSEIPSKPVNISNKKSRNISAPIMKQPDEDYLDREISKESSPYPDPPDSSEGERFCQYQEELTDAIQEFQSIVTDAETISMLDSAVVEMRFKLRTIMGGI